MADVPNRRGASGSPYRSAPYVRSVEFPYHHTLLPTRWNLDIRSPPLWRQRAPIRVPALCEEECRFELPLFEVCWIHSLFVENNTHNVVRDDLQT